MTIRESDIARTDALILAGGRGERLQPLTDSRAKPAVSFGGKFRIIDFTLSNCLRSGLDRVFLITQYRYEELHRYIRDNWVELWPQSGLSLLPPTSGKRYRGTADAVFQNVDLLQANNADFVLVLSGDHIYQMDYRPFIRRHAASGADLTVATLEYPLREASRFGVVEVDRHLKIIGFDEKPAAPRPRPSNPAMALVSMGVYVFKKQVLVDALRRICGTGQGYDFGHDVIPRLIAAGRTYAYDFQDDTHGRPRYWRDIGTVDAYYQANMDFVGPDIPFDLQTENVWPVKPALRSAAFDSGQALRGSIRGSVLAPDVEVADTAIVSESILMPGVRIGNDVRLRRAIVEEGVHVPDGFEAGFDLNEDRLRHTVTEEGVVVVRDTAERRETAVALPSVRYANAQVARSAWPLPSLIQGQRPR